MHIAIHWRRAWQPTPILAWRIPWTEEPGELQSIGSQRVRHNWSDLAHIAHSHTSTLLLGSSPGEEIGYPLQHSWAFLVAQLVKNLPAMWETWVWSLGWEDLLEERMATHSSVLAWRIPWIEEPGGLQAMGLQRARHDWVTKHSTQNIIINNSHSCDFKFLKN